MPEGSSARAWGRALQRGRPGLDLAVLLACAVAFCVHAFEYEVVQDDAYIFLVYSKNLALGHGLVFNLGERVEGYTNFLWTLILAVPHLIGLDAVAAARALGLASALGLFAATWRLARRLRPHRPALLHTPALILLAANGALGFWTLSGMETALFALLVTAAAASYAEELHGRRPHWRTGLLFGLAALTRPEGLLFFGLTVLHRLAVQVRARDLDLRAHLPSVAAFLALVAPHLAFRLAYYGHPLPNTFHAKTGLGMAYLADGLSYTWKFLVDYGFWGLGLLAPAVLLVWRRQRAAHAYLGLLVGTNALYVTLAGGDALPENRLFLPVLALMYVELQELGYRLTHLGSRALRLRWPRMWRPPVPLAALPAAAALAVLAVATHYTFSHARPQLSHSRQATQAHNRKLHDLVDYLETCPDADSMLVASTAIGIPRYLTGAAVLDLVGLTDATVARRPQPLPGVRPDHRLKNYNVGYVMDRAPDVIYFIAGERPITPAEKALFMSRRFRQGYYMGYISDRRPLYLPRGHGPGGVEEQMAPSGQFVELYAEALSPLNRGTTVALELLDSCLARAPADFDEAHRWMGRFLFHMGDIEAAGDHFERAVAADDHAIMATASLALIRILAGEVDEALGLAARAVALAPESHHCQYAYGTALLACGRYEESVVALSRAVVLDDAASSSADAAHRLAIALASVGDSSRARQVWEALLRIEPRHRGARDGLRRLRRSPP